MKSGRETQDGGECVDALTASLMSDIQEVILERMSDFTLMPRSFISPQLGTAAEDKAEILWTHEESLTVISKSDLAFMLEESLESADEDSRDYFERWAKQFRGLADKIDQALANLD